MKKLADILKTNWAMALGLALLVGIVALNGGCDDGYGQNFWWPYGNYSY